MSECKIPDNCPQAAGAAKEAVKQVFAILGVDVDKPEQVAEFQMDLRFGRSMRRATDRGMLAVVTIVAGAITAAIWVGITTNIRGH